MPLLSPAYQSKTKEALTIALPIIAGQLGQVLMGFFDTVQIGGLGSVYIAGLSFGNNIFWMVNLLGMGILFAVSTLVSEAKGENHLWKAVGIYRSGMKTALLLSLIFSGFTLVLMRYIHLFMQEEIVNQIALRYLRYLLPSVLFVFVFTACKQFLDGMGRTSVGMYVTIGGLALNVFLNWVLIYGNLGFPKLEIEGAAIATVISRGLMAFAFLLIIWRDRKIRELRKQLDASAAGKKKYGRAILRIGIPAGLQFFFEVVAFQIAHFMSGWIGINELAAHSIAIGLASITFMVLTGISASGNILTGFSYGAKDRNGIRIAGNTIFLITLGIEVVFAAVLLLFSNLLPTLYTDNAEVISIAASMLVLAAFFQMSDGLQASAAGALRGMQDVKMPMIIALVSYWGVMMPLCYLLAFKTALGLAGIWIGFIIGLTVAALLLLSRFWWMVKRVKFEDV